MWGLGLSTTLSILKNYVRKKELNFIIGGHIFPNMKWEFLKTFLEDKVQGMCIH